MRLISGSLRKISLPNSHRPQHLQCRDVILRIGLSVHLILPGRQFILNLLWADSPSSTTKQLKIVSHSWNLIDLDWFSWLRKFPRICPERSSGTARNIVASLWLLLSYRSGKTWHVAEFQRIKNMPPIPELRMPDPNPFIPKNFIVHRKEVDTVQTPRTSLT